MLKNTVGLKRKEVDDVLDKARNYITGRAKGNSGAGYGRSEAMLPGLAQQVRKIGSYL